MGQLQAGLLLSVRVLSRLFRRRFVEELSQSACRWTIAVLCEYAHLS